MEALGVVFVIFFTVFIVAGFSAIAGLILWGLARGLGNIENATFLNSWGLYWILSIVQTGLAIFWFLLLVAFTSYSWSQYINDPLSSYYMYSSPLGILMYIFYQFISILIALLITKSFWKCTFRQSFMTHLIPIIFMLIFTVGTIYYISFIFNAMNPFGVNPYYY